MSFSSGTFTFTSNTFAPTPTTGTTISSSDATSTWSEISTALSTCVLKDGTQTTTSSVPFAQGISVTTGITTGSTTFALVNTTATTINFAGAATTLNIGTATGATTIRGSTLVLGESAGGTTLNGTLGMTGVATLASPVFNTQVSGTAIAAQADVDAGTSAVKILVPSLNRVSLGTLYTTTGGATVDFTGIPAGTRRIKIMFNGVSTSSTSTMIVQIGGSGSGIIATGYVSTAIITNTPAATTSTAGFIVTQATIAADTYYGTITLDLINAATFSWSGTGVLSGAGNVHLSVGNKSLAEALDRVRITTSGGSDTFDVMSMNISYER